MLVIECTLLLLELFLGIIASLRDIRDGIIPNRMLLVFAGAALVLDGFYYGILARDTASIFLINVFVVLLVGFGLYCTHSFAGGDFKMLVVLSMLYPAGMYLSYAGKNITLFAALCFAIFYGYIYMLCKAIWRIILGETKLETSYIFKSVKAYVRTYITASIYVIFINLLFAFLSQKGLLVDSWVVLLVCITIAWTSGRIRFLKHYIMLGIVGMLDIVLSIYMKVIPLALNPRAYFFTAILLLCQLTIKTNIYETIPTARVKKGMILSSVSSLMMQNSKIEGMPGISLEDLRNRLTEKEAESVKKWGKSSKGLKEVTIVKKIPFAVFLSLGYASYFLIWSVVR